MAPTSKLLLVIEGGTRTLAMTQRVVHQVIQVLAPDGVPLCLTNGHRDYLMAFRVHCGFWVQPEQRQGKGPKPTPWWMPLPQFLYAQGVQSYRRIVRVKHRVVFGTMARVKAVLAAWERQINTAFVEVRPVGRKEALASG